MASDRKEELTGLQFLRGLCALTVVIGHCSGMMAEPKYGGLALLGGALEGGMLGVDIFFVISGFIIAIVVLGGPDYTPRITADAYIRRRLIRILPMLWLSVIGYAVLQRVFARESVDFWPYVRALLLLPYSYVKPDIVWTLRQELIFYLVFAASFFGARWRRWMMALWLLSPLLFLASLGSIWGTTAYIDSFWSVVCSAVNIEFGMGLALGMVWIRAAPCISLPLPLHPFLLQGVLIVAVIAAASMMGLVSQSLPSVTFIGLCATAMVALAAVSHCPAGWLTRLGTILGDASYSIYLFHLHLLAGVLTVRAKVPVISYPPAVFLGTMTGVVIACVLVHYFVERPVTRWLRMRYAPARSPEGNACSSSASHG